MSGQRLLTIADSIERRRVAVEEVIKQTGALKALGDEAEKLQSAWSGSSLGYHATVYYRDLQPAPAGVRFDAEWGLTEGFRNNASAAGWVEYKAADVEREIRRRAGDPDLSAIEEAAAALEAEIQDAKEEALSILSIEVASAADAYLSSILDQIQKLRLRTAGDFQSVMIPSRQVITRDRVAVSQGGRLAPHQEVIIEVALLSQPLSVAGELGRLIAQAGSHLSRIEDRKIVSERIGTNVFIGHGRSLLWRELKDFVHERLKLPYDEFNRVPVAGVTNIARLSEMLNAAAIALIVLTAEDEQADGAVRARQNVVHEAGLFQGRLGFMRAIVLLEEGCDAFSNIDGFGQIRFPKGNIKAAFDEVRQVLEREGLVQ